MHPESIDKKTKRVLEKIAQTSIAKDFYLAGGTALAIQIGHRISIDLDWFSFKKFSNSKLKESLADTGKFRLIGESEGTVHGILDGVKVSAFHYGYKTIFPKFDYLGIGLADIRDIGAMKIDAVSSRGSRKDFIDLFFLLKKYSMSELIAFFEKKYLTVEFNKLHILKSLTFFDDADREPMPIMLKNITWSKVKKEIEKQASEILYEKL